jgi:hypothetical protein
VLQNAYVSGDHGEFRAFAIEDLLWSVGIGLAAGVTALVAWRSHIRGENASADSVRLWNECLERGRSPTIEYLIQDGAVVEQKGPTITSEYTVRVRCELPETR